MLGLVSTILVVSSLQISYPVVLGNTCGVGLTAIVKLFDGPSQVTPPLLKCGVTMIVATTGAVPLFIAMNDGILPLPAAARPIDGRLFVHV